MVPHSLEGFSMEKMLTRLTTMSLIFFFFFFSTLVAGKSQGFSRTLSPEALGLKKEKLSHLHFFLHDIVEGEKATAVRVAEAWMTNTSKTGFGFLAIMDDPLTEGPDLGSKTVGRAQGMYASAAENEFALLMVLNFAFIEGKYKGSNLSLLGRNEVFSEVREMPIIGGSGVFRFARGYAQAKTHKITVESSIVEYNVLVYHY